MACMASHARTAMGSIALGSVSAAVLRRSPVPVLLVGREVETTSRYERIVVCVDGFPQAEGVLGPASDLAVRLGASLCIVQVVDTDYPPPDVVDSGYIHRLAAQIEAQPVAPREVDFDILHGPVRRAIVAFADKVPGTILALGSHGRSRVERLGVGSVALGVIRHAHCPVLVHGPGLP
jgi:nucleotide-binding universal stress UspA family protein